MAVNALIPHNKARRQKERRSTAERMLAAQPPREELGLREEQLSREVFYDEMRRQISREVKLKALLAASKKKVEEQQLEMENLHHRMDAMMKVAYNQGAQWTGAWLHSLQHAESAAGSASSNERTVHLTHLENTCPAADHLRMSELVERQAQSAEALQVAAEASGLTELLKHRQRERVREKAQAPGSLLRPSLSRNSERVEGDAINHTRAESERSRAGEVWRGEGKQRGENGGLSGKDRRRMTQRAVEMGGEAQKDRGGLHKLVSASTHSADSAGPRHVKDDGDAEGGDATRLHAPTRATLANMCGCFLKEEDARDVQWGRPTEIRVGKLVRV